MGGGGAPPSGVERHKKICMLVQWDVLSNEYALDFVVVVVYFIIGSHCRIDLIVS